MNENKSKKLYSNLGVVLVAVATFVLGITIGQKGAFSNGESVTNYRLTGLLQPEKKIEDIDFTTFWDVWDILETKYVDKDLDEKKMFFGAVQGMVSAIEDPATLFFSSEETDKYDQVMAGNFEGIGAELGYRNGQVIVKAPMRGYPAQLVGLRAGDAILEIDGISTEGMSIFDAVMKIRGERGTKVSLKVISLGEDASHDVEITRESIHVDSTVWSKEDDIAIIEIRRFTEESLTTWITHWNSVVEEVVASNPKGVILDMRGNTGGYFDAAVWAAGDFLSKGKVVSYQQDRNGEKTTFSIKRDGRLLELPLIVLVDEGSASASEILAGALQYYDRGTIIGQPTYGKGTAQQILEMADGSTLHITTQKWLLPDSSWISPDNKIVPEIEVEYSREDFEAGEDPQFDKALEVINEKI